MTTKPRPQRTFKGRIIALHAATRRIARALDEPDDGLAVAIRLGPDFVRDFQARAARLPMLGFEQTLVTGSIAVLTLTQNEAFAALRELMSLARDAARARFRGSDAMLHTEFAVGRQSARDQAAILERAHHIADACARRAADLAEAGWTPDDTTALAAAITRAEEAVLEQDIAVDERAGLTARQTAEANELYRRCLTIQRVARRLHSPSRIDEDPSIVRARARFLLDEFPRSLRRRGASQAEDLVLSNQPTDAAAPGAAPSTAPVPAAIAGSDATASSLKYAETSLLAPPAVPPAPPPVRPPRRFAGLRPLRRLLARWHR